MEDSTPQFKLVAMLDVDNTLINNDRVKVDVENQMEALVGENMAARFWQIYEEVRQEMDLVDIPLTLKRIKPEFIDQVLFNSLYRLWMDFPYPRYIYPTVFETLAYLKTFSRPLILSDGDPSFQLRKIVGSGLSKAVDGNVLIYQHKDHHFEDIVTYFPAPHYFMVEDKPSLLAAGKKFFGDRITTVLVQQGKYASQSATPPPDLVLPRIGNLMNFKPEQFLNGNF